MAALSFGGLENLPTASSPGAKTDLIWNVMRLAKRRVETLLEGFGYSFIDLGNLRDGGLIQQAGGPLAGRDFLERGK